MLNGDIIGLIFVYSYVAILLFISEKFLKDKPELSRKFLHIMVGNIAFILPIFLTREIMVFLAAVPFIPLTYLMSPYSPIKKMRGKTSNAGHEMGLVYYAITWSVLAYVFFDHLEIVAIGIVAMSYGDGFASIIGRKYGRYKYNILGDEKSIIGSYAMFVFTYILIIIIMFYYGVFNPSIYLVFLLMLISFVSTIFEGITPKGLDNLSVPFITAVLYYYLIFVM